MTADLDTLPIPDSLEEFTNDWLSTVLDTPVVRDGVEPLSVGTTGRVYRLMVRKEGASEVEPPLIVKLPAEDRGERAYYDARGFYVGESSFYRLLAPDAPIGTPRCYYARAAGNPRRMAVVLEDLSGRGFVLGDQLGATSHSTAARAVRELAKLHARWWDDGSLEALDWLPLPSRWPHVEELAQNWQTSRSEFHDELDPTAARVVDLMLSKLDAIHAQASERPLTVVHGDFRLDNLCVDPNGEIAVFDWQLVARAPGVRDLAFFVGLTDAADVDPDAGWALLVAAYVDQLRSLGIDYPKADLEYDLRLNTFYLFRVGLGALGSMDLKQERNRLLAKYILGRLALAERRLDLGAFLEREFPG